MVPLVKIALFCSAVLLKVRSLGQQQQQQHHLGIYCKFSGLNQDRLKEEFKGWDPATHVFIDPLENSNSRECLRTTFY